MIIICLTGLFIAVISLNFFFFQLFRHCVNVPTNVRITLLSSVGSTRVEKSANCKAIHINEYKRTN